MVIRNSALACLVAVAATSAHAARPVSAAAPDASSPLSRVSAATSQLPSAAPAAEGFSAQRLERIDAFLDEATRPGGYLGAVALVARHGKIVHYKAYGHADLARTRPMRTDAIFRIYSMTKTIASVAVLMLLEEGKLALDEPVDRFLPAFANAQVYAGGTPDAPQLRKPARPVTIRHLLTHTAGFATVSGEPATELLERAKLREATDLADYAARAATVPLGADPGTRFRYDGVNTEIAGRIVEVVSGKPFDAFLRERVFAPLGLRDTGFSVDVGARPRVPDFTTTDADGRLALADHVTAREPGVRLAAYASGAGGLYSTAADYWRFSQMLLDGGKPLLGRKTVELMMHNHLMQADLSIIGLYDGEGFGLGGSVVLDAGRRGRLGSAGQFGWSGASSTYYTIDPAEDLVAILMLQYLPSGGAHDLPKLQHRYYNLVYQALQ
ncbi:serine hydrolase domain-containing protein [Tahibacter soli]|uniref:Serine hydrolase n=1 Tax=Tahibacter soli TaxID=2983605 RepID=A0A9X3YRF6_9GAMM|nr:serine hydrolase domain-containing protein [Tahibacter soli]MDC8014971.1 serine hydrolase [Tahibacter soli]